jgi:predicted ATP-grasp superfamily ATP-dependent carboligase
MPPQRYRVLVTDAHTTSALAVVRSLGAVGMSVTSVGEAGRCNLANHSRYANRAITLPSAEDHPVAYAEELLRELERNACDVLIPTTDTSTTILRRYRSQFERLVRLAMPSNDALDAAQDKQITLDRARESGVPVPRTRIFGSVFEVEREAQELSYPCVVKPRFSRYWDGTGPMTRGTAHYAHCAQALRDMICGAGMPPDMFLVQEFVSGSGLGVFALMDRGNARVLFAHRRVREANPTGGRAALAESIALDERFVEPAVRLLKALEWTGVAMVEFKDQTAGSPVLMEINGRFWGSLPLAVAAGVDFPLLLVQQILGLDMPVPTNYLVGVRCRHLQSDLSYLTAAMKGRPRYWSGTFPRRLEAIAAIAPLPGRWRSFNFRPTDPWPGIREAIDFLGREARSLSRARPSVVNQVSQHP